MNRRGDRDVPADAPLKFFPARWKRFIVTDKGIDRRFYEMAAMVELKDALRSGDVWVVGSRQSKDFDEYLLPKQVFAQQKADGLIDLPVPHDAKAYLDERLALLRNMLDEVSSICSKKRRMNSSAPSAIVLWRVLPVLQPLAPSCRP